jgi:hypothetical protein
MFYIIKAERMIQCMAVLQKLIKFNTIFLSNVNYANQNYACL